jgi:tripartite-type tricarboxylate transporter receptor subunit TctC
MQTLRFVPLAPTNKICARPMVVCFLALAMLSFTRNAAADAVADFYHGKVLTIGVGFSAGGGYDLHARILARHMPKHLPGAPTIIVKNVPGGSGLTLINTLYNSAPRDGTEIATFDRAIPLQPLIDGDRGRFDPLKLNWIGSSDNDPSTCIAWHDSPVKTFDDLTKQELVVGATGSVGIALAFPRIANAVLGTKFKIINGYPGSTEVLLSMERGETQGFCSAGFATVALARPDWIRDHKVNFLVQLAIEKHRDHPDVPLALDLAKSTADRQAIELIVSSTLFARPFGAPPGVPSDRVNALRKAFNETLKDPEYLADAAQRKLQVELVTGQRVEEVLHRVYATPKTVVDFVNEAMK